MLHRPNTDALIHCEPLGRRRAEYRRILKKITAGYRQYSEKNNGPVWQACRCAAGPSAADMGTHVFRGARGVPLPRRAGAVRGGGREQLRLFGAFAAGLRGGCCRASSERFVKRSMNFGFKFYSREIVQPCW